MSTQHRPADHPPRSPPDEPTRAATPSSRITPAETDLPDRVERLQLQARIAALERSLAESERRRQAIVDQYELVLDDCVHEKRSPSESRANSDEMFPRLRRLLPIVG
ncbi:hypothetical protein [Natronobeatus ordinarius]|uniref:hypothetical protein n=1 Tax=Natronobeatus ordinarius TaxID=2963433 RepID=UPI0020CC2453|nr:hypothetical protein [Natronobeatus ordinarius]